MPPSAPHASLFRDTDLGPDPNSSDWTTAHCDGGARGNPGPAGYGAVFTDASGHILAELSEFLGVRTNNYAEYAGLLACLQWALDHGHRRLRVVSDSLLMVNQIQGKFKINSPDLRPLWEEARRRITRLETSHPQARFEIAHALRHKNKDADRLANQAMDQGTARGPARGSAPGTTGRTALSAVAHTASPPPPGHDPRSTPGAGSAPAPEVGVEPSPLAGLNPGTPRPGPRFRPQQAMLRGFTRDGAVHLLGGASLPDGVFVKVIPE